LPDRPWRVIHILNCYKLRVNVGRFATMVKWTDAFKASCWKLVITKLVRRFRTSRCGVAQLYSPLIHPYLGLTHTQATREVGLPAALCVGCAPLDCGGVWIGRTLSCCGGKGEEDAVSHMLTIAKMADVWMAAIKNRFGSGGTAWY
jgi:hypothetical protein